MANGAFLKSMPFERLAVDRETFLTDIRMFQQDAFGAVYLIDDDRKAIVETGTSWEVPRILEAVRAFVQAGPEAQGRVRTPVRAGPGRPRPATRRSGQPNQAQPVVAQPVVV